MLYGLLALVGVGLGTACPGVWTIVNPGLCGLVGGGLISSGLPTEDGGVGLGTFST